MVDGATVTPSFASASRPVGSEIRFGVSRGQLGSGARSQNRLTRPLVSDAKHHG